MQFIVLMNSFIPVTVYKYFSQSCLPFLC